MNNKYQTRPTKILHIITESNLGGAQRNTLLSIKGLKELGYNVELACGAYGPGEPLKLVQEAEKDGIKTHILFSLERKVNPFHDIEAFLEIQKILGKEKFAIIHTHSSKAGVLGRWAAYFTKIPIIIHTVHGNSFHPNQSWLKKEFYRWSEKITSQITTKLIPVGYVVADEIIEAGVASRDKLSVIHSGINFEKFDKAFDSKAIRAGIGISPDNFVVGTVGSLVPCKGHHYLIEAIATVHSIIPNVHLILVGDGPLRGELEQHGYNLNIANNISFLGYRDDVPELLSIMDVFVISSLWEGVGRALTEAMYMERPVVGTAVNGVPELIKHNVNGLLVPSKNSQALAKAILTLIQNRDKAKIFGERAKKHVYPEFSVELMVQRIHELYQQLLKIKSPSSTYSS